MSTDYHPSRWSLNDLYPSTSSPELEAAFKELDARVTEFETLRPQLTPAITVPIFLDVIRQLENISRIESELNGFAGLLFTEDTQNQTAQTLVSRVDQVIAEISNRTLFFSLWWKELEDEPAARLLAESGDYRYWLEEIRHFKPHTLSEAEEKIINIKNVTGVNALGMLYDAITNRYTFKLKIDGEVQELTRGEVMIYARHHDPDLRAQAYQELYRVYSVDGPILGQIYQTLARDWRNEQVTLRKFSSPIATRNLANDIPDEVVDTLLDVCKRNTDVFQRYFRLKAKWLGVERLRRYDLYAPVAKSDKSFSYDKAYQTVFDSFQNFDPEFAQLAQRVFDESHLDSEVRKGKRGGAFCWTVTADRTPWVMLNFQGRSDDVATMAHELGHAIHSMLAEKHTLFTAQACLPLAETASTFSEMMLVERLLEHETDDGVRRDLLFRQVDDSYATIQRQAFFALFERQAHEMIQNGASVDEISQAYLDNLREQFGDSMDVADEFRWEWVSIPHIYNVPFYVYAYTFGQLLVLALYRQFKAEGESFKPRYKKILAAGGSKAPVELLSEAGIDIRKAEFWQGGYDVIRELVEKLEAIPVK